MKNLLKSLLLFIAVLITCTLNSQDIKYQEPPKAIKDLILAPPIPEVTFTNDYKKAVVSKRNSSLNELSYIAGPEYRVAGLRIDPIFSQTRQQFIDNLSIIDVATGSEKVITGLPADAKILNVSWSPTGKYICFTNNAKDQVELWRVNASTAVAEKLSTSPLNAVLGDPYRFLDDEKILYKSVPENYGKAPVQQALPAGPIIQEHKGVARSARTSPDMITSYYDEQIFEYFAKSQLMIYTGGVNSKAGEPAIYRSVNLSPDKGYYIATAIQKPYSYQRGYQSFPYKSEVYSIDGQMLKMLEDNKTGNLSTRGDEEIEGVEFQQNGADTTGKRKMELRQSGWSWRADMPHTLVWNENETPSRRASRGASLASDSDADTSKKEQPKLKSFVYQQDAPFTSSKVLVIKSDSRVDNIQWSNAGFAIYTNTDSKAKRRNTYLFTPCDTTKQPILILSQTTELDTTGSFPVIGRPYTVTNTFGERVIWSDAKKSQILLIDSRRKDSAGDNFWFIDKLNLKTLKTENLWSGKAPYIETVETITDFKKLTIITKRESVKDVPNYFIYDIKDQKSKQITSFSDPYPSLQKLQRRFVEYKRADGLTLTANLWLPEGYDSSKDGKLPVFMWGYPYEYKTRAEAEKRRASRYNFARPGYASPIFWATQGFAVLDDFSVPIVSETKTKEPNDRFLPELISDAQAAINYLDSLGIGDKERVAVGGHSYGAFMTANLLAHTKLFKAGIARSGAYNRSLTPFGFQSEPRNYWKALSLYSDMSPFNFADKLKTPILLIHGQLDNNQGTFPVQSERMFHALVGLGGTARYVQLPFESHRYSAKESVLHVLFETDQFLKKYLINEKK